ncbi:MAG: hypothetical protein CSH36_09435 [Thalassolituus sp.]|nr:MAG: hypothetical protein CSH36_09435 [Thalassolituus sp.]
MQSLSLIACSLLIVSAPSFANGSDESNISLNLGLSGLAPALGVSLEYAPVDHLSLFVGKGIIGGLTYGARLLQDRNHGGFYAAVGYAPVEIVEDEFDDGEEVLYGLHVIGGYRFVLSNKNYISVGAGIYNRTESYDSDDPDYYDSDGSGPTYDITYGIQF